MDEMDTGTATGPEARSAEAAREWAKQRRAQARAQFEAPAWLGPTRGVEAGAQVPAQAEPDHDDDLDELDDLGAPPRVAEAPIPATAHWAEKRGSRLLAGVLLLTSLAGVLGFLALAIITQSLAAIAGLAACAIVAVIFRGALMSAGLTTVDLKGSVMRIRKRGVLDVVNLADPVHDVQLIGSPGDSAWRLRFETVDGRTVELGPREVDAAEVHRIAEHYLRIAERERRDRLRRFNR